MDAPAVHADFTVCDMPVDNGQQLVLVPAMQIQRVSGHVQACICAADFGVVDAAPVPGTAGLCNLDGIALVIPDQLEHLHHLPADDRFPAAAISLTVDFMCPQVFGQLHIHPTGNVIAAIGLQVFVRVSRCSC